jgi:hypothetical protein
MTTSSLLSFAWIDNPQERDGDRSEKNVPLGGYPMCFDQEQERLLYLRKKPRSEGGKSAWLTANAGGQPDFLKPQWAVCR